MKELRDTVIIIRRSDEAKIEIGGTIPIKEGVNGTVLARFTPSDKPEEVHYIVELKKSSGDR
jgi:hypothetical protein